jgi:deoxyribodipyrimidine photolyase-related protein
MRALRLVLGDQLTESLSALSGLDATRDVVLMAEVMGEATYVRHHQQKIAFLFSAMRHFAEELRARGITVDYIRLDDPGNSGTLQGEIVRAIRRHQPDHLVMTEPGEWRVWQMMQDCREELSLPVHILADDRFMASRDDFARWASGRKSYRMEFFYREMRRSTGLLMAGEAPVGGQWNFDAENRKRLPDQLALPRRLRFEPDETTQAVISLVSARFGDHFGDLEPFGWGVCRDQALAALDHFITTCLPLFGDYQDAMKAGEDFTFHALLSPYLNAGLLLPMEMCRAAERAWHEGRAPLNAVEGFIRQILGWREFVRGLYWHCMPEYAATNTLDARRPIPAFYWTGETDMACMRECIGTTRRNAYAHHIQRLMITGNFALLAGIAPADIEEWYLAVYADAYEWVELPNVHGMVMHADGGLLGSKPYAASGAYINRMSDYCRNCRFDPKAGPGPDSCPFNALYWNFLIENRGKLEKNPRMALPYRALGAMPDERRSAHQQQAERFLASLTPWQR